MKTEQQFGVVPSLDDLEWEWEVPDGVPLQDLLLSSVQPILQKSSVAFVEPNQSIDYEYGQMVYNNMEFNDSTWYVSNNPTADLTLNDNNMTLDSNAKIDTFDNTQNPSEGMTMSIPEVPEIDYHNDQYVSEYEQYRESSMTNNEMEYDGRRSTGSDCSNASWESYGNSSQITELSQEEIFEEIQRECAEIERRSTSPAKSASRSESSTPVLKKHSLKKKSPTMRKKELNRVAAARYREKRRIEKEQKLKELHVLEARNRELLTIHNSLNGEIKYLKELINEIHGR